MSFAVLDLDLDKTCVREILASRRDNRTKPQNQCEKLIIVTSFFC